MKENKITSDNVQPHLSRADRGTCIFARIQLSLYLQKEWMLNDGFVKVDGGAIGITENPSALLS